MSEEGRRGGGEEGRRERLKAFLPTMSVVSLFSFLRMYIYNIVIRVEKFKTF